MKNAEIKELSTKEIEARISEERASLSKLKFAHTISAVENPMRIKAVRKDIARLNTELQNRKSSETASAPAEQ